MRQSVGLQRVGHDLMTEQQQTVDLCCIPFLKKQNWSFSSLGKYLHLFPVLHWVVCCCCWVVQVFYVFWTPSSVQLLGRVWLFATPWITACQASLSITNSRRSLKLMSIESVMPFSYLILCCPCLLLPSVSPSIRVFSNVSILRMRWPKYWSFSFSVSPSKEHPGLISFRMDWLDLLAVQGTLKSLLQHHSSKASTFSTQLSSQSNSHIHTWPLVKP